MSELNAYKIAYNREKKARQLAEKLLDEKTRRLYDNVLRLEGVVLKLKTTQAQLVQSAKMASLGQLTAGIAHEINNPISYSFSNLSCLSENISEIFKLDTIIQAHDPEKNNAGAVLSQYQVVREQIDADYLISDIPSLLLDTIEGIERVKKIILNLKQISYKGDGQLIACNINNCIKDCVKAAANELKYSMEIKLNLADCGNILGQPYNLNQVFINLFINASHACETHGLLTIRSVIDIDNVIIYVQDNGKGISEKDILNIFDPFYTTKPLGEGTGLGLPISLAIIEQHNGIIEVQSEVNVGTCFKITLPIAK
ncbi:MAG: two-component system NtrC family sensor kinase [Francisellaceae bacterium]|jgi:signal transduction histidine kinase